jgi:hypothetical protein
MELRQLHDVGAPGFDRAQQPAPEGVAEGPLRARLHLPHHAPPTALEAGEEGVHPVERGARHHAQDLQRGQVVGPGRLAWARHDDPAPPRTASWTVAPQPLDGGGRAAARVDPVGQQRHRQARPRVDPERRPGEPGVPVASGAPPHEALVLSARHRRQGPTEAPARPVGRPRLFPSRLEPQALGRHVWVGPQPSTRVAGEVGRRPEEPGVARDPSQTAAFSSWTSPSSTRSRQPQSSVAATGTPPTARSRSRPSRAARRPRGARRRRAVRERPARRWRRAA